MYKLENINNISVIRLICSNLFMIEVTIAIIENNLKVSFELGNFIGNNSTEWKIHFYG